MATRDFFARTVAVDYGNFTVRLDGGGTALTANRLLTLDVQNADRTLSLGGNLSLASSFTTSGAFGVTLTATSTTSLILPTSGTLATTGSNVFTGDQSISAAGSTGTGQLTFTGATNNWIDFGAIGVAAPAFTTRSLGTKIVLFNGVSAAAADYALGVESNNLWFSTSTTAAGFKWYGGTTLAASLSGTGTLTTAGPVILSATGSSLGTTTQNYLGTSSSGIWLNTATGTTGYLGVGGSGVLTWSATGVAVTGTLQASGISSLDGSGVVAPLRITHPGGAAYGTNAASISGAIRIQMPVGLINSMLRFTVKIYEYSGSAAQIANSPARILHLGGYNNAGGWYTAFAHQDTQNGSDINVRFGYDGAKSCVWIGDATSTWVYPQIFVTDFEAGYSNATMANWSSGWNILFDTAVPNAGGTVYVTTSALRRATLNGTETLTSKTLTSPLVNGGTVGVAASLTAGTDAQGQAPITSDYTIITTAATNPSGVTLPSPTSGRNLFIINKGANPVDVYPASGGTINGLATNAPLLLPVNGIVELVSSSTTQWYAQLAQTTSFGPTAPTAPAAGDIWVNTTSGIRYTYYNDGDSSQWVQFTGLSYATSVISVINPSTPKDGDIKVVGAVISVYASGSWRQIFPAVYS